MRVALLSTSDTDLLSARASGADYVLANFGTEEAAALPEIIAAAADATETLVRSGVTAAMNQFNRR